jgi:hypothetical protein
MNAFTGQTFQMNQLISIKQVVEYTVLVVQLFMT